jgi:hypothetical protein
MLERGAVVLEPKNALKLAALEAGEAPSMEGLSGKRHGSRWTGDPELRKLGTNQYPPFGVAMKISRKLGNNCNVQQ